MKRMPGGLVWGPLSGMRELEKLLPAARAGLWGKASTSGWGGWEGRVSMRVGGSPEWGPGALSTTECLGSARRKEVLWLGKDLVDSGPQSPPSVCHSDLGQPVNQSGLGWRVQKIPCRPLPPLGSLQDAQLVGMEGVGLMADAFHVIPKCPSNSNGV